MTNHPKKTIILQSGGNTQRPGTKNVRETGLLMNFNVAKKGGFSLEPVLVIQQKDSRNFQRIPVSGNLHLSFLSGLPPGLAAVLRKLTDEALIAYLVKRGFAWLQDADKPFDHLDERHFSLLREWTGGVLEELKPLMPFVRHLYYLRRGEGFSPLNIRPAGISAFTPSLEFVAVKDNGLLSLQTRVLINKESFPLEDFEQLPFFLRSRNEFFLLKGEDYQALAGLASQPKERPVEELSVFLAGVVKPLAEKYSVDTRNIVRSEIIDRSPEAKCFVSELNENFLLIKPKWSYGPVEVEEWEGAETVVEEGEVVYRILRKREEERVLPEWIRSLHPKFAGQSNGYFYLSFKEALEKNWFLQFYHALQERDIPILGMQHLRKFKYNTHIPVLTILAGKNIDWFDLTIEVHYGDQRVAAGDLRKAILNRQEYILLDDGSLGVLPAEWIGKYSLLMKMGHMKEGRLKISSIHWNLLEELPRAAAAGADEATDAPFEQESLQSELEEKRERLRSFDTSKVWPVPATVNASLRDYQQAGFQWLCLLDDMGWGGCLADDMGLGKTLQTISFLQHLALRYPTETNLVVCPTSLIYNWEIELRKFAPGLPYHIHYGVDRVFDDSVFNGNRLILTSYGMVRNDSEHFRKFRFGYIVLDESQAIKNPASQVYKAVQALDSRNRVALSGTPVQNNTFDLYAQMHFLNPGMLGSADFFKAEFANPIDKNGDRLAAARLRKLVYPFLLRRTKEQVAADLPDKTEMILWCEMGPAQRKIYDRFKNYYRDSILEKIGEEGIGRSSIFILEGLTKLRQICDSPALLKEGMEERDGDRDLERSGKIDEENDERIGKSEGEARENGERQLIGENGGIWEEGGESEVGESESGERERQEGGRYPNTSVKLDELVREIAENTGDHKALVFSQFTSMLKLIRAELEERGIPYLYLDGSVSATGRKQSVEQFQEQADVRVFLISLKAGGVGLTLTAADYVYLVDPWWNPAAEQQAIDRTHRIGQSRKVFAYRMICKDTVEEKILQLQERKKSLAADLIGDETGFVKKLTAEDIGYLFS
ncbi:MAG: DEAD/DEAH box helicase [Puia sp.]|nr:DEAD/DEAH box helicase [Puia sp.]